MSNAGRPRTGMKPCKHCQSTDRDSNGQCRCRNAAYRALSGAPKATATKARKVYDAHLRSGGGDVEAALFTMREEFPSLAARARKAPADRAEKGISTEQAHKGKRIGEASEPPAEVAEDNQRPEPERYWLHILDDFTDPHPYARKDAAIKNGVRSGESWGVRYKGKVVAQSDDLL